MNFYLYLFVFQLSMRSASIHSTTHDPVSRCNRRLSVVMLLELLSCAIVSGFQLKLFGFEKQASLCMRHNVGVSKNHNIVNNVLQTCKCYYCRLPTQPRNLVPLMLCPDCAIGTERCIFMNY
jgi:hypothetical protein